MALFFFLLFLLLRPCFGTDQFIWYASLSETPSTLRQARGIWSAGALFVSKTGNSDLNAYTKDPAGLATTTQYVWTADSPVGAALELGLRSKGKVKRSAETVLHLYQARAGWSAIDAGVAPEGYKRIAVIDVIPWTQVVAWYAVRLEDVKKEGDQAARLTEKLHYRCNPEYRPDKTVPVVSGEVLRLDTTNIDEALRIFRQEHRPQPLPKDRDALKSLNWDRTRVSDSVKTAIAEGRVGQDECVAATRMVMPRWIVPMDEGVEEGGVFSWREYITRKKRDEEWSEPEKVPEPKKELEPVVRLLDDGGSPCKALATVARDVLEGEDAKVVVCSGPEFGEDCEMEPVPSGAGCRNMLDGKHASTVQPNVVAGYCDFYGYKNCQSRPLLRTAFPGNKHLDIFAGRQLNRRIMSFRCYGVEEETQISSPEDSIAGTTTPDIEFETQIPPTIESTVEKTRPVTETQSTADTARQPGRPKAASVTLCSDGKHPKCEEDKYKWDECVDLPSNLNDRVSQWYTTTAYTECKFFVHCGCRGPFFNERLKLSQRLDITRHPDFVGKISALRCRLRRLDPANPRVRSLNLRLRIGSDPAAGTDNQLSVSFNLGEAAIISSKPIAPGSTLDVSLDMHALFGTGADSMHEKELTTMRITRHLQGKNHDNIHVDYIQITAHTDNGDLFEAWRPHSFLAPGSLAAYHSENAAIFEQRLQWRKVARPLSKSHIKSIDAQPGRTHPHQMSGVNGQPHTDGINIFVPVDRTEG